MNYTFIIFLVGRCQLFKHVKIPTPGRTGEYNLTVAFSMELTLLSPFWRVEFRDNPYIFGEFMNPCN